MRIRYRKKALAELAGIRSFIAASDARAAKRVVAERRRRIDKLSHIPEKYRPGPVEGTRELVVVRYGQIVTYRIHETEAAILSVFRAAQDIPRGG